MDILKENMERGWEKVAEEKTQIGDQGEYGARMRIKKTKIWIENCAGLIEMDHYFSIEAGEKDERYLVKRR